MIKSCWGRLVNSWSPFSSCFVRLVSSSASADFSIACCTVLLFLWRCVSVGVERSEFTHMHFVLHSCLNLEPLADQLQPYLKRGEGGWLAMEVSCRVETVSYSCEWKYLLSCLETVGCVSYFFQVQTLLFFGKLKLPFLQNYSKQETWNEIKQIWMPVTRFIRILQLSIKSNSLFSRNRDSY